MRSRLTWIGIAVIVLGGAVYYYVYVMRPQRGTDREQILQLIADVEKAVEQERVSGVMRHISEDYEDSHGFNRRMVQRMVVAGVHDPQTLNLSVQVPQIEVIGDTATFVAEVDLATGDAPVSADTAHHLTVTGHLRREGGTWKVVSADGWQGAEQTYY